MSSHSNNRGFIKNLLVSGVVVLSAGLSATATAVVRDNSQMINTQFVQSDISDRLIVKLNAPQTQMSIMSSTNAASVMSKRAKRKMKKLRRMYDGSYVMKLERKASSAEMNEIIDELMTDPSVASVTVDKLWQPLFEPNDQYYDLQWHYFEPTGGLNLPDAWDITTGTGVTVAVLDTGYRPHPDLVGNLVGGYDMIGDTDVSVDGDGRDSDATDPGDSCNGSSSSWHGTHVAGTVAAVSNNGTGVAGVAFGAKVVPVRVLGACGGYTSDIADGMIWAAGGNVSGVPSNPNPAQVLNLSLGGSGACDSVTQSAINTARGLGATVVVAAGNSNVNASNASPANCSGVITVAATNRSGGKASYSNFGSVVDLAAPGGQMSSANDSNGILSTLNSGSTTPGSDNYAYYQGTSMAAPHVAGVAALVYAVDPAITPDEVESILKSTTRSFPSSCSSCGTGIVDATAALAAIVDLPTPTPNPTPTPTPGDSVLSNGVAKTGISGAQSSEVVYTMEVPAGASDLSFSISGGSGDADMYVRYGSSPTTSSYDCRPYRNGNSETCSFSSAPAGTYYVMLRGYSSYAGVSLVGSYEGGDDDTGGTGISEQNLSGSTYSWQHFTMEVGSGASSLDVAISGGSGDADLYVRYGAQPTTSSYSCRPYRNGNTESCSFSSPSAGTWYISLRGYSSYSGVNLEAQAD